MPPRPTPILAFAALAFVLAACASAAPATSSPTTGGSLLISPPGGSASSGPSSAASAAASAAPSSSGEAATGRIVDAADGFAITLPDGWQRIGLTAATSSNDVATVVAAARISPADAATYVDTLRAILPGGVRLLAIRPASFSPTSKYMTSLNILRLPAGGLTLDKLEQANVAQLEALNVVKPIDHIRLTLPAGDAIRFTYGFRVPSSALPGGIVQTTQYLLLGGDHQYIVTLSTGGPPTADERADLQSIMDSFAFVQ